jgi:hypothetical protein
VSPPSFLIVGTPRSGTTLVQRLCCELGGVAVPAETHFFSLLAPGLLRRPLPLGAEGVGRELRRFAGLSTSRTLPLDLEAAAERAGAPAGALDLFAAIVETLAPGAGILGEKTPNHLLWWRPLRRAAPELRWVLVVRDPRAVVASYRTAWGARDHVVLADRWRADQREGIRLLRAIPPDGALLVRYEDVVASPRRARGRLGDFLGVTPAQPPEPVPAGRLALPSEPWKARAAGPIDPRRASAWRELLTPREAADVVAIAGGTMRRFGYAAPGAGPRLVGRARIAPAAQRRRMRFRRRRAVKRCRNAWLGRRL